MKYKVKIFQWRGLIDYILKGALAYEARNIENNRNLF